MYNPQIFPPMMRNEIEMESLGDPLRTCSPGGSGNCVTPNY